MCISTMETAYSSQPVSNEHSIFYFILLFVILINISDTVFSKKKNKQQISKFSEKTYSNSDWRCFRGIFWKNVFFSLNVIRSHSVELSEFPRNTLFLLGVFIEIFATNSRSSSQS